MNRKIPPGLLALVTLTSLVACSTTYDTGVTTTTSSTTTTVPTGTTEELLANVLKAATGLGDAIVDNSADAKDRINYINANWEVALGDLAVLTEDDIEPMAQLVKLANTAVERKRPADADKVQKFLPDVIDALLRKI